MPISKTEKAHANARGLDKCTGEDIAALMGHANHEAATAFEIAQESIGDAIDAIGDRLQAGGRLTFIGAGTSGRLAVLEAAECPPTFATPPELIRAIMAGGADAFLAAIEGAEDDAAAGARAVDDLAPMDVLVGISASGGAPFVQGALAQVRDRGTLTVLVTSNPARAKDPVDIPIILDTGPEILAGSTRLKAATAAKMTLNALTTGVMARLGRVYGPWMVEVRPTNKKLRARAQRLIAEIGRCDANRAAALLDDCEGDVKAAIVCARRKVSYHQAKTLLDACQRRLRKVIS